MAHVGVEIKLYTLTFKMMYFVFLSNVSSIIMYNPEQKSCIRGLRNHRALAIPRPVSTSVFRLLPAKEIVVGIWIGISVIEEFFLDTF